ncbi:MAG: trimethylamine methyltransferase family protein, partial [Proteobacteria bacterium]|nr:trimethylamine methyltransferase family protein [Pseudomonadota bacterium]
MPRQSRRGHRKPRSGGGFKQPPWRRISNPYAPIEVLREEQVEQIHLASMKVLEDLGLEFLDGEALDILDNAGADVDHSTKRVRFDRGLIAESIAKAPPTFTIHARN